jgi:hypothetical protein
MTRPLFALVAVSCMTMAAVWMLAVDSSSESLAIHRRLPGAEAYNLDSAEAGFIAGVVLVGLVVCLLCCCMCGRGCNLWDLVAMVCLWEMCCDRDGGVGNFDAMC